MPLPHARPPPWACPRWSPPLPRSCSNFLQTPRPQAQTIPLTVAAALHPLLPWGRLLLPMRQVQPPPPLPLLKVPRWFRPQSLPLQQPQVLPRLSRSLALHQACPSWCLRSPRCSSRCRRRPRQPVLSNPQEDPIRAPLAGRRRRRQRPPELHPQSLPPRLMTEPMRVALALPSLAHPLLPPQAQCPPPLGLPRSALRVLRPRSRREVPPCHRQRQ
mmetsp:Transcript_21709/g.63862  ORF Transcript_21709/g.63862 Transcript_21709/m.63862 type:complete len:216 (-) Transcript_21709:265-912(-)